MNYKKITLAFAGLAAVSVGLVAPLLAPHVSAASVPSFTWQDAQTITDNAGNVYYYSKSVGSGTQLGARPGDTVSHIAIFVAKYHNGVQCTPPSNYAQHDGSLTYSNKDFNYQGASVLLVPTTGPTAVGGSGALMRGSGAYISFSNSTQPNDPGCATAPYATVNIADPQASTILFNWFDSNNIVSLPSRGNVTYTLNPSIAGRYDAKSGTCPDYIQVDPNAPSKGSYYKGSTSSNNSQGGCSWNPTGPVALGLTGNAAIPGSGTSGPTPSQATGGSSSNASVNCGTTVSNPLSWIICPIIDLGQKFIGQVDNFITQALIFDTKSVFHDQAGYYTAWNSFRIIATALLVVAGLVMVASQALGFELLDAYTIRKTLPRLLIAVIGISLSWPLMEFAISFVNALGVDVRNLIYSPFGSDIKGNIGGSTLLAMNIALLGSVAFLGFLGSLSFLATAVLAILVGFFIIVARDLALTVIIIVAPVAIASYVLPNTQKVWKLWSDNFIGLLMVFPIISAFIALGKVLSAVSLQGTNTNAPGAGTAAQVIGVAAYFLPYFMLPIAFRLATGAIGALGGFINDRGRGAFDRLKKFRGNRVADNTANMRAGTRFNNRGLNALTSRATTRNLGFGSRGRSAYNQKTDIGAMDFAKSAQGQAIQHNDAALRAMTYGSAVEAKANMEKDWGMNEAEINSAVAAAKANGGFGRARQVYAAQQLAATGTGYDNIEQAAKTIARVSHGNKAQISSLAGNINSTTKSASRHDLAPSFATLNDLSMQESGLGSTNSVTNADGSTSAATYNVAHGNAWNSASLYQHANDKSKNLQAAVDHFKGELTSGDPARAEKGAIFLRELQAMAPNATGDNKKVIDKALHEDGLEGVLKSHAMEVDPATGKLRPRMQRVRRVDPADPNNMIYEDMPVTLGDIAAPQAREYQRPDPNNIT